MKLAVVPVTDEAGNLVPGEWLLRAGAVHRQLRDRLPLDQEAYRATLARVCAGGGRLCLALEDGEIRGLALWRLLENTFEGRRLYVDDLVVDAPFRSRGVGRALLQWLEAHAGTLSCTVLALDSGVGRSDAHRFYFREGFFIPSFCFRKTLT
ncbi:MAG: GNAT family N-acetyltransferase [Azoarcus sp.]|nr:GNAT family N-acetyltransferase [Azoarcus sp.]